VSIAAELQQEAPRTTARAERRAGLVLPLAAATAVGAALRFATLGVQSFDYDEAHTARILGGSLGHALHLIPLTESTPPLYYVVAWLWSRVFGVSEFGLRSLSALLGTALVPVAFVIGRRLGSGRAGLIAALLASVNPFFVWYSQEGRSYALLALLTALSFWAFIDALERPEARRFAVWAAASAAAVLTHYFAGYLVTAEAVWLVVATRRRGAVIASVAVAAVGAALTPLVISQTDNRSQWIEALSLWSRIKEVAKKWVTGEIAPTRNGELAVVAVLVVVAVAYAAARLTVRERRGVTLAFDIGVAALLIPLVLDVAGFHYLISKNVMPSLVVLLVGAALVLGCERAGIVGLAGAAVACAFFLAITLDGAIDPALQRPDYRSAARALGAPAREQVVVSPNLGDAPLALYRPGAESMPVGGWLTRQVVLVEPLPRADLSSVRPATPTPPPGFALEARTDAPTYTLICFAAPAPAFVAPGPLIALAGVGGPTAQVWPHARTALPKLSCQR
jgi:hypothetical protein